MLEVMVTVAIIGVLAAIAVPSFMKETSKSKGSTEVGEMIAEISVRQEQWRTENGAYLAAPACPAAPSVGGQSPSACLASGGPWDRLRLRLPEKLRCSYAIVSGDTSGTNNPLGFTFTSPDEAWYYVVATCDLDGNSSSNSRYFFASTGSERQVQNEGR